jgi:quinol monooxygenase YgiN
MESSDRLSLSTCSIHMRFKIKDVDNAVRLLLSVKGSTRAKRGCHTCEVGMEAADTGLVHYREEWESGETFLKHVRSEEFRRVLIALDMCCEEPRIVVGNLSGRSGMSPLLEMRENVWVRIATDGP